MGVHVIQHPTSSKIMGVHVIPLHSPVKVIPGSMEAARTPKSWLPRCVIRMNSIFCSSCRASRKHECGPHAIRRTCDRLKTCPTDLVFQPLTDILLIWMCNCEVGWIRAGQFAKGVYPFLPCFSLTNPHANFTIASHMRCNLICDTY
jgi:hypothetical protein